jgi:hypothetical protein
MHTGSVDNETINFKNALPQPPTAVELDDDIRALAIEGSVVSVLDDDGEETFVLTPHGFFSDLPNDNSDTACLRPLLNALETRGLIALSTIHGVPRWSITKKGITVGLDSRVEPLDVALRKLGLDREMERVAAIAGAEPISDAVH